MKCQADLFQIVRALGAGRSLAHFLDGREQQADQNRDDRDDDQELDERKPASMTNRGHDSPSQKKWKKAKRYCPRPKRFPCGDRTASARRTITGTLAGSSRKWRSLVRDAPLSKPASLRIIHYGNDFRSNCNGNMRNSSRILARQTLTFQAIELAQVDRLEPDSVADTKRKVPLGHIDKFQGRPPNQVPTAGSL